MGKKGQLGAIAKSLLNCTWCRCDECDWDGAPSWYCGGSQTHGIEGGDDVKATPSGTEMEKGKPINSSLDSSVVDCCADSDQLAQSVAKNRLICLYHKVITLSLPSVHHFSGEGPSAGDESFERWLKRSEDRAVLTGWLDDNRKYRLKTHLDNTAFHAYQN